MKTIDVREDITKTGQETIKVVYRDDRSISYYPDQPNFFTIEDECRRLGIYLSDLDTFIKAAIALRDELKAKN